jgi:nucleotide-binding universal stress UspA family protein
MIMPKGNVENKRTAVNVSFPSFKRILVAYDGMEMSKRALSYAAYFSKKSDTEIVLVNVVKANTDLKKVLPLTINANLEGKEEEEQRLPMAKSEQQIPLYEHLRGIVEEMTTSCKAAGLAKKVTYEIRIGNPAEEIINVSHIMSFDLIIMGSRRIASRIQAIGSTTRKVVTTVKTPLLIVQKQPTYKDEY